MSWDTNALPELEGKWTPALGLAGGDAVDLGVNIAA
jgi:hypothetical protein